MLVELTKLEQRYDAVLAGRVVDIKVTGELLEVWDGAQLLKIRVENVSRRDPQETCGDPSCALRHDQGCPASTEHSQAHREPEQVDRAVCAGRPNRDPSSVALGPSNDISR